MLIIVSYLEAYEVVWLILLLGSSSPLFGEVVALTSCHDLNFILFGECPIQTQEVRLSESHDIHVDTCISLKLLNIT